MKPKVVVNIAPPAEPRTSAEWQNAVDAAEALRCLHGARLYGLVTGGVGVNIERCQELLERGRKLGFFPSPDAVERFVRETNGEA